MNESTTSKPAKAASRTVLVRRIVPIAVLIAGFVAFFALDLDVFVSLEALKENRETLRMLVSDNGIVAILAFGAIYAVVIAFSLPGGAIMTLTGGFLFGALGGGLCFLLFCLVVHGACLYTTGVPKRSQIHLTAKLHQQYNSRAAAAQRCVLCVCVCVCMCGF